MQRYVHVCVLIYYTLSTKILRNVCVHCWDTQLGEDDDMKQTLAHSASLCRVSSCHRCRSDRHDSR